MKNVPEFSINKADLPALDSLAVCQQCYMQMGEHYEIQMDGKLVLACPDAVEKVIAQTLPGFAINLKQKIKSVFEKNNIKKFLTVFLKRHYKELTEEQVLKLSGFHPEQPYYFEVEHSETCVGYRVIKYNRDHEMVETIDFPNMPKYLVIDEKYKIQCKANYEFMMSRQS